MPAVSERQRRAMWAAAEGRSSLGIPRSVGEEFVGRDCAAGTLYVAPTGRVLLVRRTHDDVSDFGGYWDLPGGRAEPGEDPLTAAERESLEEVGSSPGLRRLLDSRQSSTGGLVYHTFGAPAPEEFLPRLSAEHDTYVWAPLDRLPAPLHPGLAETLSERLGLGGGELTGEETAALQGGLGSWLAEVSDDSDCVAMDRETVRSRDADGHLHVTRSPISKACVSPYFGREIPGSEQLGLAPQRIYMMLRHPEELERAALTFARKPLLHQHRPVASDDHPSALTVGTVGEDVRWEPPYLTAPLTLWDGAAIALVESGEQRELSASYRYRADMVPGTWDGQHYDGIMRDIVGNHVALVREGRAGPDVLVGDSSMASRFAAVKFDGRLALDDDIKRDEDGKFAAGGSVESMSRDLVRLKDKLTVAMQRAHQSGKQSHMNEVTALKDKVRQLGERLEKASGHAQDSKESSMTKAKLSRMGLVAAGALVAYLAPRLAQDAQVDVTPLLAGVSAKNWKDKRAGLSASVSELVTGKLAKDANIADLAELLNALSGEGIEEAVGEVEEATGRDIDEDGKVEGGEGEVDAGGDADGENGEGGGSVKEKVLGLLRGKLDEEDLAAIASCFEPGAMDEDMDKDKENMVDKKAMDEAITAAKTAAKTEMLSTVREIREAERAVRPYVGELSVACDSAADVYRAALTVLGVRGADKLHADALLPVLQAQPLPDRARKPAPAMDAESVGSFQKMYPAARPVRMV